MSRKYFDLAILKSNKPNSKKTLNEFAQQFGYDVYTKQDIEIDKRAIGITIVSEDLFYELENFSKNSKDKFTLSYSKVDKKDPSIVHIIQKNEFLEGKMILEEKNDTKKILIEKEEQSIQDKNRQIQKNKPQHKSSNPHHKGTYQNKNNGNPQNNSQNGKPNNRPQHAKPQHAKPQHAKPQHAKPQHAKPQHAKPQHAKPQHAKPQHAKPQHVKPQPVQMAEIETNITENKKPVIINLRRKQKS
jgi:hypothetical protein